MSPAPTRRRRPLVILVLIAVAALAVVGWMRRLDPASPVSAETQESTYTVSRRNLDITVTATGHLKAKDSKVVTAPVENRQVTAVFLIEEGSVVKEGDELLRFDDEEVRKQIVELEQAQIDRTTDVETAKAELDIKNASAVVDRQKAALELENAKLGLDKALEGDLKVQQFKHEIQIEETKLRLGRLEKEVADMQRLNEAEQMFSADQILDKRAELEKCKTELESARLELDTFTKYTKPMDEAVKRGAVDAAETGVENTDRRLAAEKTSAEARLRKAEENLRKNEEELTKAREQLEKMVVKSPGDGIVVYGDPDRPWDDKPRVGATFWQGQTIMTLPILSVMQVQVEIHESEVAKLRVGQKASVVLEIDPRITYKGELTRIGAVASEGGWREDSRVRKFRCEITLEGREDGHKPGLTARVEIHAETLPDVLAVPLQAVHVREGEHLVYLPPASAPVVRKVTLGASNANYVQVTEGLAEGDVILLVSPPQAP